MNNIINIESYSKFLEVLKQINSTSVLKSFNIFILARDRTDQENKYRIFTTDASTHKFIVEDSDKAILQLIKNRLKKVAQNFDQFSEEDQQEIREVKRILLLPLENQEVQNLIIKIRPLLIKQLESSEGRQIDTVSEIDKIFTETWFETVKKRPLCYCTEQKIVVVYDNPQTRFTLVYEETWLRLLKNGLFPKISPDDMAAYLSKRSFSLYQRK